MGTADVIDNIEKEFNKITENKAWDQVYLKIRTEGAYDYECSAARTLANKNLNRYRDVLPYDSTRITLHESTPDYINASLVEVESINRQYILAQGPLPHTTSHFWLMTWQQKSRGIVMLNKTMEKNQIKCHQYFPLGEKRGGETFIEFPAVSLKVELLKEVSHSHYIYRTFRLSNTSTNESRDILHFHYTTWPDFGVPQSPEAFFKFLNVVRASRCLEKQYGPAIIHCSAGIGRSGTFCLVDSILIMISRNECSAECGKVLEVLLDMRKYRMGLIQTADQLKFSYQAIIYGGRQMDTINGKDPSEESSSEEVSQEDPPPLPPPRTDSLSRSMVEGELDVEDDEETGSDSDELEEDPFDEDRERISMGIYQRDSKELLPNGPLPAEPGNTSSPNGSSEEKHNDRENDCETPAKRRRF